ncbi:MAG: hypothetical protein PGN29_09710 [Gordonia paraffinivorans]
MSDDLRSLPVGIQPMRPVDHLPEPPHPAGFVFSGPGRRRWVIGAVFAALIVASAVIGTWIGGGWTYTVVQGTVILMVLLVVDAGLKRWARRRDQRPRIRA